MRVSVETVMNGRPVVDGLKLKCADPNIRDETPDSPIVQLKRTLKRNAVGRLIADDISEGSSVSKTSSSTDFDSRRENDELPAKRTRTEVQPRASVVPKAAARGNGSKRESKDENEDRCDYCNETGFLICCDVCPAAFHPQCHHPSLRTVPDGKFVCYRCSWTSHYERNPVRPKSLFCLSESKIELEEAEAAYTSALLLEQIRTARIVPYEVPDELTANIPKIPPVLPNDELVRKKKRKADPTNDCYVCLGQTTTSDSNQCYFCSNAVHLDCDPVASCSTRFHVWRCPMHLENYLDSYFLTSTSTYTRIELWQEFAQQPLDYAAVERKFVQRLAEESLARDVDEAASGLRALKFAVRTEKPKSLEPERPLEYTGVEMRMIALNSRVLFNEVFQDPTSIAAFFPAFKTSTPPLVYTRRRPLSFGTSAKCSMNLSQFSFNCVNMSRVQLEMCSKEGIDYLKHTGSTAYTHVNGTFLMERSRTFADRCECIRSDRARVGPEQVRSQVAVFSDKLYTVQLGCAVFYLVFNPALRRSA